MDPVRERAIKQRVMKNSLIIIVAILGFLAVPAVADAADRYWVGGTGNWNDDDNHWATSSGGTPADGNLPTASDNCIFDGSSSGGAAYTVTVNVSATCLDFTMGAPGGGNNVTWAGSSALAISGSMNLSAGSADITRTYTGTITFNATTSGKTITLNGVSLASSFTFNGSGGEWTLQDALTTTGSITLTAGSLNTNGVAVNISSLASTSSSTRTLTLGASTVTMTGNWNITNSTSFTFNANTSTLTSNNTNFTFTGAGFTYNTVNITGGASTTNTINNRNTFANLTLTGGAGVANVFSLTQSQTITGTFTVAGNSAANRVLIASSVIGTARTLTAAAVTISNADFRDITGAGAATWNISAATGGSGDCGGNSGITFTTATTRYWVGGTGNWNATTEWAASSGGASGATAPLCQDDVVFDNGSFNGTGQTVTNNAARMGKSIDWTAYSEGQTPTLSITTNGAIFGSLTLISGMTFSGTVVLTFEGRSTYTLTTAGKSIGHQIQLNAPGGTLTLQDALTSTSTITVNNGHLDLNDVNVTCTTFSSSSTAARTISMGGGTLTLTASGTPFSLSSTTNLTFNRETSTIKLTNNSSTVKSFSGGGQTYYNFWNATAGTGDVEISGSNTFNDIRIDAGRVNRFTAGTTTTLTTLTATGSPGNMITISSVTSASHTLLKADSNQTNNDYLILKYSTATPSCTFFAGTNSTDGGNNSGWTFTAPASCVAADETKPDDFIIIIQ